MMTVNGYKKQAVNREDVDDLEKFDKHNNDDKLVYECKGNDQVKSCDSMLVDSGATSHITNNDNNFSSLNESFKPEYHVIELADGTKQNAAMKQGTLNIQLKNDFGKICEGSLSDTLYIPSFP